MTYEDFIERKTQVGADHGFDPLWMPDSLFDFQRALTEWALRKGRAAIFADCGLGKTPMQLVWAENVVQKTNGRVLILTPLAVGAQTIREGEKFGVDCHQSRDGKWPADKRIIVTNYEKLHLFDAAEFSGCVCDESSVIKHNTGATQKLVTRFMAKLSYRLLCTATAAPNDFIELGTSSGALGELSHSEMLSRFFRQCDNKRMDKEAKEQAFAEQASNYFGKLSFRVVQTIGQWRLKYHAQELFWRWVSSWARACRKPSDIGFSDERFCLPPLREKHHIISPDSPAPGMLFTVPACGLGEEREERKRTLQERCQYAADLVDHDRPAVVWCQTNAEGDLLEDMIEDASQVAGRTPDDEKEERYKAFASGQQRVLIIKPKIGAWGLNWQHCNHVVSFVSHSYEQYYQSIRRCWRFGQRSPVDVDIIATEGESRVIDNMHRKVQQADMMFEMLVKYMQDGLHIEREDKHTAQMEVPEWL